MADLDLDAIRERAAANCDICGGRCTDHAFVIHNDVPKLLAEVKRLTEERDLAVAHDRQPYPTAWAYEQACKALETQRDRAKEAEAAITRARETLRIWRDERAMEPQTARLLYEVGAALTAPADTDKAGECERNA